MVRRARTRLAGTLAVTALSVTVATEVAAQDRSLVLNEQLQLGEILAGERLNVVDASAGVQLSVAAQGNSLSGGVLDQPMDLVSRQDMAGATRAAAELTLGGETNAVVVGSVQARANYLAGTATNTALGLEARQTASGPVEASTGLTGTDALLVGGAHLSSAAIANTVALSATGKADARGALTGTIDQGMTGTVQASTRGSPRFVRGTSEFASHAIANAAELTSGPNTHQEWDVRQRSSGPAVVANTGIYAGNGWNLAARANATANTANFYNQGGSLITAVDQGNSAFVRSDAELNAYDFGKATAVANATGNQVTIGNNDIYLSIDNSQTNTGGVEAQATFTGSQGYDAYVGANAVGNSVTGFSCSDCGPNMNVTNNQVNSGNVSAVANTVINGTGRHVVTGTTAVGNAASFYTTRPGG